MRKNWNLLLVIALLMISFNGFSQKHKKAKKNQYSIAKGALFGYWGYNISSYTRSTIRFVGPGYDFKLAHAYAHDRPEYKIRQYFRPTTWTIPQYNIRLGYFFKDHWAIAAGMDHLKYVLGNYNQVPLTGHIDPSLNTPWVGDHVNMPVVTRNEEFHYENTDGNNYIHFDVIYAKYLYRTRQGEFAITAMGGLGAGGIVSVDDFTFAGTKTMKRYSLSGYGITGLVGIRLEFFKHFFINTEVSGGFMHQVKVLNRPNTKDYYTSHYFGEAMFQIDLGGIVYIHSKKNSCDTCPKW